MTESDAQEVVRAGLAAFNRADMLAGDHWTEDCEFVSITAGQIEGGTYRGHDGLRRYAEDRSAAWEELHFEPDEFIEDGERLIVVGLLSGRGRGSGIEVDQRVAVVCEVRDGKLYRAHAYPNVDAALADRDA